jgi:hypothetical protein
MKVIQRSETVAARLERAIVRFRLQSAHNLLDEAFGATAPDVVARDLVLPVFEQLEQGGDPVVVRFAASLFEIRLLLQASGWDHVDGPPVVLACAPREERTLGLIALGLGLARRRCRIVYLGATTPARTIAMAVAEHDGAPAVLSAEHDDLDAQERTHPRTLRLGLIGRAAGALAGPLDATVTSLDGAAVAAEATRRSSRRGDDTSPPSP